MELIIQQAAVCSEEGWEIKNGKENCWFFDWKVVGYIIWELWIEENNCLVLLAKLIDIMSKYLG